MFNMARISKGVRLSGAAAGSSFSMVRIEALVVVLEGREAVAIPQAPAADTAGATAETGTATQTMRQTRAALAAVVAVVVRVAEATAPAAPATAAAAIAVKAMPLTLTQTSLVVAVVEIEAIAAARSAKAVRRTTSMFWVMVLHQRQVLLVAASPAKGVVCV